MNVQELLWSFLKLHPVEAIVNILILFIYYPVEIIVLSILFSRVYERLTGVKKNPTPLIKELVLLMVLLLGLEFLMDYREWVNANFFPELEEYMRHNILSTVIKTLSTNYYEIDMGDLASRLHKIPWTVATAYDSFNRFVAPFLFTVIGITIFIYFIDVRLEPVSTVFMVIYLSIFFILYQYCLTKAQTRDKKEDEMMEEIDDKVRNLMNIFTSGEQSNEIQKLKFLQDEFKKTSTDEFRSRLKIDIFIGILDFIYFAALIGFTIYYRKQLSQPQIVLMVTLMIFFIRHLRMFSAESLVSSFYLGTILENNTFFKELDGNHIVKKGQATNFIREGRIDFQNLSFVYHNKEIFHNLTATIEPHDIVLISGKSGSGKSTILKLIQGFYQPSSGRILIDGQDIQKADLQYLRNHITYVPQHCILFHGSIIDNISYGTNLTNQEAYRAIRKLPILELLGNDLERDVGKLGNSLSGGQRQVVLLLRAYLRKNPIFLVDEPTASVDKENRQLIYDMLKKMARDSTVVVISHDEGMTSITSTKIQVN